MRVIDLSQSIYTGMEVYPGDPEVKIDVARTYKKDSWLLRQVTLGTHTGTHVDVFSHMDEKGKNLDEIPISRFFGEACVVRLNDYYPPFTGLIFKEAVEIGYLNKILSVDPPFVGGELSVDLERALLENEVITYTGLANLDLLPENEIFIFCGFPLKIKEGEASPIRAVAFLNNDHPFLEWKGGVCGM